MRIIGLTGGIASGKSSVARLLKKMGAVVVDADQLSRDAVMPGEPAYDAIVAEFGEGILSPERTINRRALAKIVFADANARKRLERITHPAIAKLAQERLESLRRAGRETAFYMAPLLIEAGVASRVDEIWVVYAERETQIQRLMDRDCVSREEALQRLDAQMPMEEKVRRGRIVIDNNGSLEGLEQQVRKIWERETKKAP